MKPVDRIKQVRILHQGSHGSKDIFDQLSEQRDSYLQHLENITKFSKAGKKKQQDNTYKLEWLDERKRLDQLAHKVEQSVNQLVQMLLMQDVQNNTWHNYIQEQENAQTERNNLKTSYRKQLQEIKTLHSDYAFQGNGKKSSTAAASDKRARPSRHSNAITPVMRSQSSDSARKHMNNATTLESGDALVSRNNDIIAAYLAELYLALHSQQTTAYTALEEEEAGLTRELKTLSRYFHGMMVEDELSRQSLDYEEEVTDLVTRIQASAERIDLLHSQHSPTPSSSTTPSQAPEKWTLAQLLAYLLSASKYETLYETLTSLYTQLRTLDSQYYQTNNNTTGNNSASMSTPRSTMSGCGFKQEKWSVRAMDCFHKWKTKANFSGMARGRFVQLLLQELKHLSSSSSSSSAKSSMKKNMMMKSNKNSTTVVMESIVEEAQEEPTDNHGDDNDVEVNEDVYQNDNDNDNNDNETESGKQSNQDNLTNNTTTTAALFTIEDILEYEQYYEQKRKTSQQLQQQEKQYFLSRETVFTQITDLLGQVQQQVEQEYDEVQDFYTFQSHKQAIATRLAALQEEYTARKTKEQEVRSQQEAMAREAQQRQEELEESRRQQMKDMLTEYHALQARREAELKQAEALMAAEQEKVRQEERKQNAPKIEHRQQLYEAKQQQLKAKEEELLLQEEKKMELLIKLAEQVPYFQAIQDIAPRFDQLTFCTQQGQYLPIPDEANLAKQRGHMPLLGFTDQKVVRDTRFRIMEALRMAGLQHTQAAKDIVQQYHPRPHLAIHGIL